MKNCSNHIDRRVFSKGLCVQCYKSKYPSTLKRTPLKRKPFSIARVSPKRKEQNKTYAGQRREFLSEHPVCQVHREGCLHYSSDIHHTKLRGKHFLDVSTFMAVCRKCHNWIHENPKEARELGYLK